MAGAPLLKLQAAEKAARVGDGVIERTGTSLKWKRIRSDKGIEGACYNERHRRTTGRVKQCIKACLSSFQAIVKSAWLDVGRRARLA